MFSETKTWLVKTVVGARELEQQLNILQADGWDIFAVHVVQWGDRIQREIVASKQPGGQLQARNCLVKDLDFGQTPPNVAMGIIRALHNFGITDVNAVCSHSLLEVLQIPSFGRKHLNALQEAIEKIGRSLGDHVNT